MVRKGPYPPSPPERYGRRFASGAAIPAKQASTMPNVLLPLRLRLALLCLTATAAPLVISRQHNEESWKMSEAFRKAQMWKDAASGPWTLYQVLAWRWP